MRRLLLLLLACLLVGPVAAQVMVNPRILPRVQTQTVPQNTNPAQFDIANDPEKARAEINRLRAKNRDLRVQFNNTLVNLQQLRGQIDEMTRAGGSLVTAQCLSRTLSCNTAGASEDCSASGYTCAAVSGLCHRSCTSSDMCASGFACDIPSARCVVPAPASDE